jgi:hypothetical protein
MRICFSENEREAILRATWEIAHKCAASRHVVTEQEMKDRDWTRYLPPQYPGQSWRRVYSDEDDKAWREWHYDWRGRIHRDPSEGPAYIEHYWEDGSLYREDYVWHGKLHRIDGPAWRLYSPDGTVHSEDWYRFGRLHRDPFEGPAYFGDGMTCYCWHGYDFRDPRLGPTRIDTLPGGVIQETYAEDIPPRPIPPINWLRRTFGCAPSEGGYF